MHYCKGLHARYSNNFHEALQELNLARKDNQFGVEVIYNMVEIYLNPESDLNVRRPPPPPPAVAESSLFSFSGAGFHGRCCQGVLGWSCLSWCD